MQFTQYKTQLVAVHLQILLSLFFTSFSQSITLQKILNQQQSQQYDPSQPPLQNGVIKLTVDQFALTLNQYDMIYDKAGFNFYLKLYWTDQRLQYQNLSNIPQLQMQSFIFIRDQQSIETIWVPFIQVIQKEEGLGESKVPFTQSLKIYPNGRVEYIQEFKVELECYSTSTKFQYPRSQSKCNLIFFESSYGNQFIQFDQNSNSKPTRDNSILIDQDIKYSISIHDLQLQQTFTDGLNSNIRNSAANISIDIHQYFMLFSTSSLSPSLSINKMSMKILQYVIPSIIFSLIAYSAFYLHQSQYISRLLITTISLLCQLILLSSQIQSSNDTQINQWISHYVLISLLFIAFALMLQCMLLHFVSFYNETMYQIQDLLKMVSQDLKLVEDIEELKQQQSTKIVEIQIDNHNTLKEDFIAQQMSHVQGAIKEEMKIEQNNNKEQLSPPPQSNTQFDYLKQHSKSSVHTFKLRNTKPDYKQQAAHLQLQQSIDPEQAELDDYLLNNQSSLRSTPFHKEMQQKQRIREILEQGTNKYKLANTLRPNQVIAELEMDQQNENPNQSLNLSIASNRERNHNQHHIHERNSSDLKHLHEDLDNKDQTQKMFSTRQQESNIKEIDEQNHITMMAQDILGRNETTEDKRKERKQSKDESNDKTESKDSIKAKEIQLNKDLIHQVHDLACFQRSIQYLKQFGFSSVFSKQGMLFMIKLDLLIQCLDKRYIYKDGLHLKQLEDVVEYWTNFYFQLAYYISNYLDFVLKYQYLSGYSLFFGIMNFMIGQLGEGIVFCILSGLIQIPFWTMLIRHCKNKKFVYKFSQF